MNVRLALIVFALAALSGGCADRQMRAHAAALVDASAALERETAAFVAARGAVVRLRQRAAVEDRQAAAEQQRSTARVLIGWKLGGDEAQAKRAAYFEQIAAASDAMAEAQERTFEWEESVRDTRSALAIERTALHRFVLDLVQLARPGRFAERARFYGEIGGQVGPKVAEELKAIRDSISGAKASTKE